MDGLLIDSERFMWKISMKKACANQNIPMNDELHSRLMGMSENRVKEILKKEFGPEFDYKKYRADMNESNSEIAEKGTIPLMKGTRELMDYCHENDIKMAIATTTRHEQALKILNRIGIDQEFDFLVGGDEVEKGKPAPDIFLKALDHFGYEKNEALVFEDGHSGARAAISSGMRLVLVPDLAALSDEDLTQAYRVLNRIDEIIEDIKNENFKSSMIV